MNLMDTIAPILALPLPGPSIPPPRSLYRFSLEKYEAMIRAGVFTNRDRLELIEGYLVAKMTKYPPHTVSSQLCRVRLERILPPGWHLRIEGPIRIPSRASIPEPDLVVTRGEIRDYGARDPEPPDVALVIEVADSSLDDDRNVMSRIYGGGGVALYWIVNLVDRQVEVYSGPSGSSEPLGYRHCEVYRPGQEVPLVINGTEVARIPVADLLP
jgi:Uma2 family endonuclease